MQLLVLSAAIHLLFFPAHPASIVSALVQEQNQGHTLAAQTSVTINDTYRAHRHSGRDSGFGSSESEGRKIRGNVKLSGKTYRTVCTCDKNFQAPTSQCAAPSKLRIHQEETHQRNGLTPDQLHRILGGPSKFLNMTFVRNTPFSDLDPRHTDRTQGTPGGEFGEFLHALGAFETLLDTSLSEVEVNLHLKRWLKWKERGIHKFEFTTDTAAIDHLQKHLHVEDQEGAIVDINMASPDPVYREAILNDITQPKNQGSIFVKALLRNPRQYYLSESLVHSLIRAVFRVLWDRSETDHDGYFLSSRIDLNVLDGSTSVVRPRAWFNIRSTRGCEKEKRAAVFAPNTMIYVNHPHAAKVLRRSISEYFALQNSYISADEMMALINRRAATSLDTFVKGIPKIPFYTISVE